MKQTKYSMLLKILLLVLVSLLLSSCIIDDDFDEQEQALLDNYSSLFQERAVLQYGEHAKVVDIKAEIHSSNSILFPVFEYSVGSNLFGTIQVGDEQFEALYLTEQDEIYSKRNADKIKQSAVQLFTDMGMDVVDIFMNELYLPDNVVAFKDLPENGYNIYAELLVTNDLSAYSVSDFNWVSKYGNGEYRGKLTFMQLNDLSEKEAIREKWNEDEIVFVPHNPRVLDDESDEYTNLFDYFNVESYLYVRKYLSESPDELWEYVYKNKDGVLIEDTIE